VCFDRATGVADTLRVQLGHQAAAGAAVAYCNVTHAAEALIRLFDPAEVERALGNATLAQRMFDFGDYMGVIAAQLASAATLHDEASRATKAILGSGLFDAAFHENGPATMGLAAVRAATRDYVARGQKGLLRYNPRPGFNEGIASRRLRQPGPALDPNGSEPTHRCVILREDPGRRVTRATLRLRTALGNRGITPGSSGFWGLSEAGEYDSLVACRRPPVCLICRVPSWKLCWWNCWASWPI